MTEAVLIKLGWVLAAVVAYGLLRWRLMDATHGFRVRAGREADQWASDPRVPEREQRALQGMADRMYRWSTPWLVVVATVVVMLKPSGRLSTFRQTSDPQIRNDITRLNARLVFAAVATSPLASLIAGIVLLAGLLVRNSVTALGERLATVAEAFPGRV